METKLARISEISTKRPNTKFSSIGDLINAEMLRGCHDAIKLLNVMIEKRKTNWILDADIKGFFNNLDQDWIIRFIESKISDSNIIRLVKRMLKSGIMKDYHFEDTEMGSGQGGLCRYPHNEPWGYPLLLQSKRWLVQSEEKN